jgi:hypothetical protein
MEANKKFRQKREKMVKTEIKNIEANLYIFFKKRESVSSQKLLDEVNV